MTGMSDIPHPFYAVPIFSDGHGDCVTILSRWRRLKDWFMLKFTKKPLRDMKEMYDMCSQFWKDEDE